MVWFDLEAIVSPAAQLESTGLDVVGEVFHVYNTGRLYQSSNIFTTIKDEN